MKWEEKKMKDNFFQLAICDEWTAISYIAQSQSNPKKAIAELVENSIDAHATNIVIVRWKEKGSLHIRVSDNGEGVPPDNEKRPDFNRVGTNICNSIKKKMKDRKGIQGEFGIGLLGFWCVGEELIMQSKPKGCKTYFMIMKRETKGAKSGKSRKEKNFNGTDVVIRRLDRPAMHQLTVEKLKAYLGSELRNRIRETGVRIKIEDKTMRKELIVEPIEFKGEKIKAIPSTITTADGSSIKADLYLAFPKEGETVNVSILRRDTQVKKSILEIDELNHSPWNKNRLEGTIDYPNLSIAPATRTEIRPDRNLVLFTDALEKIEPQLEELIEEREQEKEKQASKKIMKDIQKAFEDIWDKLSADGYEWFDIATKTKKLKPSEHKEAGPLDSVTIVPHLTDAEINGEKKLTAKPYDKKGVLIEEDLKFDWKIVSGPGEIRPGFSNTAVFMSGPNTGIANVEVEVSQDTLKKKARAQIIIVLEKIKVNRIWEPTRRGLPTYDFESDSLQDWRSKWDDKFKLIKINDEHRDYKLVRSKVKEERKYIGKLYCKELVLLNYGSDLQEKVLERLIGMLIFLEKNL